MTEAYPLHWPAGWPRAKFREYTRFKTGFTKARDNTLHQIRLMGGKDVIISSNIALRNDGLPYANQKQPDDAGIAVYFKYKKNPMCFACDRWNTTQANLHAIGKSIEALRGIERWGASDMMERAFTGFQSLPGPNDIGMPHWRQVIDYDGADVSEADKLFKVEMQKAHPDKPDGDANLFTQLTAAREQMKQELC